jgi:hypothetical protein
MYTAWSIELIYLHVFTLDTSGEANKARYFSSICYSLCFSIKSLFGNLFARASNSYTHTHTPYTSYWQQLSFSHIFGHALRSRHTCVPKICLKNLYFSCISVYKMEIICNNRWNIFGNLLHDTPREKYSIAF